jgi:hypothetical protein
MLRASLVRFHRDVLLDRFYSPALKCLKNSSCERSAPASLRLPEQSSDIKAMPANGSRLETLAESCEERSSFCDGLLNRL